MRKSDTTILHRQNITTANSGLNASAVYLVASSFFFAFLFILVDSFSFRSRHLRKAAERYSQWFIDDYSIYE